MYSPYPTRPTGLARTTAVTTPTVCPVCRSTAIASVTRNPDENAYWRCDACGEIWNAGRRSPR